MKKRKRDCSMFTSPPPLRSVWFESICVKDSHRIVLSEAEWILSPQLLLKSIRQAERILCYITGNVAWIAETKL